MHHAMQCTDGSRRGQWRAQNPPASDDPRPLAPPHRRPRQHQKAAAHCGLGAVVCPAAALEAPLCPDAPASKSKLQTHRQTILAITLLNTWIRLLRLGSCTMAGQSLRLQQEGTIGPASLHDHLISILKDADHLACPRHHKPGRAAARWTVFRHFWH